MPTPTDDSSAEDNDLSADTDPSTDSAAFDVVEATVAEIHDAIENRDLTVRSLVEAYLARIEAYDADLNAILTVNPGARDRADRLDSAFESEGFVGPLHGVPIVLKDNHDTGDMPTTAGSKALEESVPPRDAFVVSQLREAGGVVLAKANLQEFSFGVDTISSLGGETSNAYALDRRPSGSSGGTAAAIAANLGAIGTGSDTCSSVRSPPAFNNLVGVRPTRGLVSRTGIVPLSETQDTAGPIARTVADAALTLDAMVGYDPEDPVTANGVGNVPEGGYVAHLDEDGLDGARIGVVREFFGRSDDESATEAEAERVTATVEDAIAEMDAAGATVVDPVEVTDTDFLDSARVLPYEFARDFDRYLAGLDDPPYDSLADIVASGQVAEAVGSRIEGSEILDTDPETLDENAEYLRKLDRRRRIADETTALLVERDLDALVYPPSAIPPVEMPARQPFSELRCELAAHTGLPAVVLQAGFTDDGLPVGVELLGRKFAEPRLFELAYGYEQASDHRRPPERFGKLA
ncbi:amidase [Halorussus amylolyticus]|uniref:amidase n=1 Tax=Halorussus amylolyticus TaxID=1126242 RepID=UPI00105104E3|nr:amidase family protein [Halorussus amylolyticus]